MYFSADNAVDQDDSQMSTFSDNSETFSGTTQDWSGAEEDGNENITSTENELETSENNESMGGDSPYDIGIHFKSTTIDWKHN